MALVFNRASDNYLFHGSQFKAGNTRDFLRLSTANDEAVIDLCNNSNIDISATDVFINGNKVVTSSGTSGPTLGSLEVTGTTVLQDLSAGATDISSTLNVAGATTLSSTLDVTGVTTLTGALDANSTADIADTLTLSKGSGTGLSVTADASVGGTLGVTGATTLSSTLDVTGAVQIGSGQNGSLTIGSGVNGGKIHSTATQHELVIDPFALDADRTTEDASGVVTILGDLVVRGNTTTFHSVNVDISDHNLTLASGTNVTAGMADGAGITVGNDSYATFTFDSTNTKWETNIDLDVSGALAVSGALSGATSIDGTGNLTMGTITMTGFSVDADGDTVTKSINNTHGGITDTGDIAGATDITGSGDLTMGTITMTGFSVDADGDTVTKSLSLAGNLTTSNNTAQIPVTMSTFEREIGNNIQTQDLSALGGVDTTTYQDANGWSVTRTVLSGHSYIKMEFKANFISSPEFDQTLSFRVVRSLNGGNYDEDNPVFEDTEIGSNMGVTIRGVYNGTYIDDLADGLTAGQSVAYKLQVKRNKASGDTIQTAFGIVPGGNYIFLQELYQPNA